MIQFIVQNRSMFIGISLTDMFKIHVSSDRYAASEWYGSHGSDGKDYGPIGHETV